MAKMIQIRNVPDELHRKLKMKAAKEGITLSAYLLRLATELGARPTPEELMERFRKLPKVKLSVSHAEVVRRERKAR